ADRNLGARRHMAAVAHMLSQPTEDALRRRLAPPRLFGDGIEDGEMLGMVRHQLAPELERVLADRMGKLIHEAFEIDALWLMFTPRQNPGGTCGLRMAWSIRRFGMV